ncbi:hypothetical protein GCM10016455_01880 [Aliiroseovarius zhejiangensis]|uniref:DUF2484 family protein n=1 Tax=Aliiroseovarius zhejiangensis TaxID=1632025 RepID=A0ABQ3IP72_9RHOB|nr:DUF2484 family protein [Aliiroseovarius zhejiangensis]GHE86090.1 hypothetical protein GCM10016455_01880 [Aliiroseovarius zhejiangensis]
MSPALIAATLWVIAASAVAFLPMRRQFAPGFALLAAAPVLIIWIGVVHGWIWSAIGLAAFISMFRRPLWYLGRRALGRV